MSDGKNFASTIRPAATVTNAYVQGTSVDVLYSRGASLNVSVSLGNALTTVSLIVQTSPNTSGTWYTTTPSSQNGSVTTGVIEHVYTIAANGQYTLPIRDLHAKYLNASVKGNITVTNSSVEVIAFVGST